MVNKRLKEIVKECLNEFESDPFIRKSEGIFFVNNAIRDINKWENVDIPFKIKTNKSMYSFKLICCKSKDSAVIITTELDSKNCIKRSYTLSELCVEI